MDEINLGKVVGPQGPAGAPGKDGMDGFSPAIVENGQNTEWDYRLDVINEDGRFTTPNLLPLESPTVLWDNKSPGADFASQEVDINSGLRDAVDSCRYIEVLFKTYASGSIMCSTGKMLSKGRGGFVSGGISRSLLRYVAEGSGGGIYSREFYFPYGSSSNIFFYDCYFNQGFTSNKSVSNRFMIPVVVLGYR